MVEVTTVGTNLYSCCLVGFFLDKMRSTRTFRMESTYYSRHKRWWLDPSISISLWPFLHILFYTIPIFLFWKLKGLSIYTGTTVYKPVPHHPNFFHCSFELHVCRHSRPCHHIFLKLHWIVAPTISCRYLIHNVWTRYGFFSVVDFIQASLGQYFFWVQIALWTFQQSFIPATRSNIKTSVGWILLILPIHNLAINNRFILVL
jgi:hypothetical protein